ncbi:MAG: DUF5329 family protein [Gammaproteobacteria bacterium]|nr:DUF5329 family protein [Gammaproteobacteria bacterium]
MSRTIVWSWPVLLVVTMIPLIALGQTDSMNDEIDYLIGSVGKGGCTFIRNGNKYTGINARAHLKSKRRRNAHFIDSTEEFIEKIASQSATSGKPYVIRCKGEREQNAGDWLNTLLAQRRNRY